MFGKWSIVATLFGGLVTSVAGAQIITANKTDCSQLNTTKGPFLYQNINTQQHSIDGHT